MTGRTSNGVSTPAKRAKTSVSKSRTNRNRPFVASYIPRPLQLGKTSLPLRLENTLRYADVVSLVTGAGGNQTHLFSCNGLYDPNITGIGHQPLYFDQLVALYKHYTVLSSKIKITAINNSDIGHAGVATLYIDDDTTLIVAEHARQEAIGATTVVMNPHVTLPQSLRASFNAAKTFGGNVVDNEELSGDAGANPAEQSYYALCLHAAALETWEFHVEMEFRTVWHELATPLQS